MTAIDFQKMGGLVPAIIQDATTKTVLMLGFMNEEAYLKTLELKKVTFYSRVHIREVEPFASYLYVASVRFLLGTR
jgi:phosphoribosyl-AMP cyclohydrolase